MPARPLVLSAAVAALVPVALAGPASAHGTAHRASGTSTASASASGVSARSHVYARASVVSGARTAYSGRYAKFTASFRCERGRLYALDGVLEQPSRDAIATSDDEPRTGVCTGSTQRRIVYLVVQRAEGRSTPVRLVTGRGEATVVLSTASRAGRGVRLDAAALSRVSVTPR